MRWRFIFVECRKTSERTVWKCFAKSSESLEGVGLSALGASLWNRKVLCQCDVVGGVYEEMQ